MMVLWLLEMAFSQVKRCNSVLTQKKPSLFLQYVFLSLQNIQLPILRNDLSQVVKSWPPVTPYMEAPP